MEILKRRLPANAAAKEYLEALEPLYIKVRWAKYAVMELPFSGYYKEFNGQLIPLVWQYDDKNGEDDAYFLRAATVVTSGQIYGWTFSEKNAERWLKEMRESEE